MEDPSAMIVPFVAETGSRGCVGVDVKGLQPYK